VCAARVFDLGMALARIGLVGAFVAVALALSWGSGAEAAEVRLERLQFDCTRMLCPPNYGERLVVSGGRGEANRLSLASGAAGEFRVRDVGAPLRAGPGCTSSGQQLVVCPTSTPRVMAFVFAGDRGDTVTSSVAVNIDGGGGNDRLGGSPRTDALYGGEGRDVVRGNDGHDVLRDGRLSRVQPVEEYDGRAFPPVLEPTAPVPPERDLFDGGVGSDTLGYEGRRRGVVADLARTDRHAGAPGEGDSLRRLEQLEGGNGGDLLLGDDETNLLVGGDGDDRLVGRAGHDSLALGAGSNRARGGAGDDTIAALRDNVLVERQRIACGPGRDHVSDMFENDFAEDDCETVVIAELHQVQALLPPASLERPPLASYSTEPADCFAAECRLTLEARLARSPKPRRPDLVGLLLGRASATIPFRGLTTLTVQLAARGSRLLRRHRSLLVRISLTNVIPDQPGFTAAGAYLTRLRAPAP
jgi:RTX calcium-binding nonapeptide repeat (4 copies)